MDFLEAIIEKAKSLQKRLVLTRGDELKTIEAARVVMEERLASTVTIIGKESDVCKLAAEEGVNISNAYIINPEHSPNFESYVEEYYELRKTKGITLEMAKSAMLKPVNWGAMMVHMGDADAVVAGAHDSAVDVFMAGLTILGINPNVSTASSCTIVVSPDTCWGEDGAFIFSDCSIITNPTAEQLADIAICAAQSCKALLGSEAYVALLSHSSKGSKGEHRDIEKVRAAMEMIKHREPKLIVDGEMQLDAALLPSVMDYKIPDSPVKGKVNTLVFPDKDAGNIAYQIAKLFGKAQVFGPFLQGFKKPINYISHGAALSGAVITCAVSLAEAN